MTLCEIYIMKFETLHSGRPWFGESVDKKLSDLTEDEVFMKPLAGVHSIAEILNHIAQWRIEIASRLQTGTINLKENDPNDWIDLIQLKKMGWENVKMEFYNSKNSLINFLKSTNDDFLNKPVKEGSKATYRHFIEGLIDHDIYHLGQVGLVKKMIRS